MCLIELRMEYTKLYLVSQDYRFICENNTLRFQSDHFLKIAVIRHFSRGNVVLNHLLQ